MADDKQNRQIATGFPTVIGVNRWGGARPNLTTVLATTNVSGMPVANFQPAAPLSIRGLTNAIEGLVTGRQGSQGNSRPVVAAPANSASAASMPAIVAGRYGKGRTLALAFPITSPSAAWPLRFRHRR